MYTHLFVFGCVIPCLYECVHVCMYAWMLESVHLQVCVYEERTLSDGTRVYVCAFMYIAAHTEHVTCKF